MVAATHQISISRPASICHIPLINSLREVSSRMSAFQASPVAPEGSSCSSAMNAARQIAYWSSLFISMMDSSNAVNVTSTTTSATGSSVSLSVPSSQPPSASSCSLPPHVTTPSLQQAPFPSSVMGQTPTSSSGIPQPSSSSTVNTSPLSSVLSSQPSSASSCPPHVTTPSLQQAPSPSFFGQTPTRSGVIAQPAVSPTTDTSSSRSVSSRQPLCTSSRSFPPYAITPSLQQVHPPSLLLGQNLTSSGIIPQPGTSGFQSSHQTRSTSATSSSLTSSLPSTLSTVSALPPHLSVPSSNARMLSPHPPPGSAVIPPPPVASCHEVPSSGQTMHALSMSSHFQSSELSAVSSTLSSPLPLSQFTSPSSCTVSSSFGQPGSSLPCIGTSLTAQHSSAPSFLQPPSLSSGIQLLPQHFPAAAIHQFPPVNTRSVNVPLLGDAPYSNHPSPPVNQPIQVYTQSTLPSSASVLSSQGNSSSLVIDPNTLSVHAKYGLPGQSCVDWLNSLHIQRNVESLEQVKEIWELGSRGCPPLKDWTALMRNYKSSKGKNTSIYSQRKYMYIFFQQHGFDVNSVFAQYNEVKPGKWYKLLNTKKK